jgi:hypothetical protein
LRVHRTAGGEIVADGSGTPAHDVVGKAALPTTGSIPTTAEETAPTPRTRKPTR